MRVLAYFGIESSGLSLAVDLLVLFVVVLYFALIYWTYADARRRIVDPVMVGCATAASLFPFVGTIIYMILRPPEYLEDVRERELETRAAEARLHELDQSLCPHCSYRVERDFIRCPSCLRKLKERCVSCSRPLDQTWTICPYCETDVPGIPPQRSRRSQTGRSRRPVAPLETELPDLESLTGEAADEQTATAVVQESAATSAPGPRGAPAERSPAADPLNERPRQEDHMDRTLILVKPDAFARGLSGEIIARFERKGLTIVALRHMVVSRELAERHYAEHAERPFFSELVEFITSAPILAMVLEGPEAVKAARQAIGATNPLEAAPGTIRGDFAIETGTNMVHGSDSAESAAREAGLFFEGLQP